MTVVNMVTSDSAAATSSRVSVRACFLGQSIAIQALRDAAAVTLSPLVLAMEPEGHVVVFNYGVVVMFGLVKAVEKEFLATLMPHIQMAFAEPETEDAEIEITVTNAGKVQDGLIFMESLDLPRLQIVAEVMAKSVVLAHYEVEAAAVFDKIEPYAAGLQQQQQPSIQGNRLLKQIGQTLLIRHKIIGRVEIIEKPELLWDYPDLDLLYRRLEDEYEIRERHSVLERKLDLVSSTVETVLDLQRQKIGLRLELYVVILIVVEVLLSLYELFFHTN